LYNAGAVSNLSEVKIIEIVAVLVKMKDIIRLVFT